MQKKNSSKKIDKAFHSALQSGDLKDAQTALASGADINSWSGHDTALIRAIEEHALDTITFLVREGADVSAPSRHSTPLSASIVACAKRAMPDANKRTRDEVLALTYDFSVIDLLLEKDADISQLNKYNRGAIGTALTHMPYHFELHQKVVSKKSVNTDDFAHFQPLCIAIQKDLVESVNLLISFGAKLKENTMLSLAIEYNASKVFKALLADQKDIEESEKAALFKAVKRDSTEILADLLRHFEIDNPVELFKYVELKDRQTFQLAKSFGKISSGHLAQALLTAIDYAKIESEYIKELIDEGADVMAKNDEGRNAVYLCALHGHKGLLEQFLDLKIPTENALFACQKNYDVKTAEILLAFGADPEIQNEFSQTFLKSLEEELWNMKDAARQDRLIKRQLGREIENSEAFIKWLKGRLEG